MHNSREIFDNPRLSMDFSRIIENELWENLKFDAKALKNSINQLIFSGESIIDKLETVHHNIEFSEIKDEYINLEDLYNNNYIWTFKDYIKDSVDWISSIAQCIHDEVQTYLVRLGVPQYNDFDTPPDNKNAVPTPTTAEKLACYLDSIASYLTEKKKGTNTLPSAEEIFSNINITNENINSHLITPFPTPTTYLNTATDETKQLFDKILAFEINDRASDFIRKSTVVNEQIQSLFSNTIPAINTLLSSSKYKYEEANFWDKFQEKDEKIKHDAHLSANEKEKYINQLRWAYYINDIKKKNSKLGNFLSKLYTVDLTIATDPNKYYSTAPITNVFDYSLVDHNSLRDFLEEMADISLNNLFIWETDSKSPAAEALKLSLKNIDEFKTFYKELADDQITSIQLIAPTFWATPTPGLSINVKKTIKSWANPWLENLQQYSWKDLPWDSFPITYEIKKSDIEALSLKTEDKVNLLNFLSWVDHDNEKYTFQWDNIWKLIYLFFLFNSTVPINTLDDKAQKDVQKVFWKAKNKQHIDTTTTQNFINRIESLGKDNVKFKEWSEIRIPRQDSELPWWWAMRMKVKIGKINKERGTFIWQVFWWELEFSWGLEWKSREFDMNDATINSINSLVQEWSPILVDAANTNFNLYREAHPKLCESLSFPPEWTQWDWDKFTHKITDEEGNEKVEEVKYFWWWVWDNAFSYKIQYLPQRKKFNVSTVFAWEKKWPKWVSTPIRYKYNKDMDWNTFLLFMKEKKLSPQTEEDHLINNAKQEQKLKMLNGWHRHVNRFSISSLVWSIKSITKTVKWKIEEYNKGQQSKLEDILIWDWRIYDKLSHVLWFIPSFKSWLWELQAEYYNNRDNRTRKKIEYYLKFFQSDPDFWTTFDQVPPHIRTQYWKSLQDIILNRVANAKGQMWDPWIYQAAALLLANIEKWWSPYRWLRAQENSWLWVKALLGNAHYQQFMSDKAELIKARDAAEKSGSWDKKWLNEKLASCEMKYIINNIRWSYKWLIVWSYEERWLPWEDNTAYIDNPAKRLLSDQFASKLESAYEGRFNKDSVNNKYSKFSKNNSFDEIENEFWKTGSTRYQVWQAALRRMIDLSNDSLKKRMNQHFLEYLLCGALDINCDPWLKKQVYWRAAPMMFVPWLLVKEANVAENVATLLDAATNNDFSKNVTEYFHSSSQLKWWPADFKKLQKQLSTWLTDSKFDEINKFFKKMPCADFSNLPEPQQTVLKNYQKAMIDSSPDEFDRGILDNPWNVSNWLISRVEVANTRMVIKNWEFVGKDLDEKGNMAKFWKEVSKDIKNYNRSDKREVSFVLQKFFDRFWIDSQQVYQWIITADYYKNKNPWHFEIPYNSHINLDMWNIWSKEINSILWYAFQGNAWKSRWLWCDRLPDELLKALNDFTNFFQNAFDNGTLLDKYVVNNTFKPKSDNILPLLMCSRDVYDQALAWWNWDFPAMFDSTTDEDADLSSGDSAKVQKAIKRIKSKLIKSSDFINWDIASIEKRLKSNLGWTSTQFPSVTSSQSKTLRDSLFGWDSSSQRSSQTNVHPLFGWHAAAA